MATDFSLLFGSKKGKVGYNKTGLWRIESAGLLWCPSLIRSNIWYGLQVEAAGVGATWGNWKTENMTTVISVGKGSIRERIKYCSWGSSYFIPSLTLYLKQGGACWLTGVGRHCSYRKTLGYKMEMRTGVRGVGLNSVVQNAILYNSSILKVVIMRKCLRKRKI